MTDKVGAPEVRLNYHIIRNLTSEEEKANGAVTYVANVPASEILKIGTDGNLRQYIGALDNLKKRTTTHRAIQATMVDQPDRFIQYNSGFLVGASSAEVDDKAKVIVLRDASVNNGAQSQGEVKRYFEEGLKKGLDRQDFTIRVEFSIEPKPETRVEIAIARNTTTQIEDISMVGKRGFIDDIAKSFGKHYPNAKLSKSETDIGPEFVDTSKLLQVLWAMIPNELGSGGEVAVEARTRAYKGQASCLKDFVRLQKEAKGSDPDPLLVARYKYFVDMAGPAWSAYVTWQTHEAWKKLRFRDGLQITKNQDGGIESLEDGILFPCLAAFSNFVTLEEDGYRFRMPHGFNQNEFAKQARLVLTESCHGKPKEMGRSPSAYQQMLMVTGFYKNASDKDKGPGISGGRQAPKRTKEKTANQGTLSLILGD